MRIIFLSARNTDRSSFQVGALSLLNVLSGVTIFLTGILSAGYFGIGRELDFYYAGLTIPALFVSLVGFDYFGTNFFPIYSRVRRENGEKEANLLANSIISTVSLLLLFLVILLYTFAYFFHKLVFSGFDDAMLHGTIVMFRIICPSVILQIPAVFIGYILQYEKKVVFSQASSFINAGTTLIIFLAFKEMLGIRSLAIGTLAGSIFGLIFLLSLAKGYRFRPRINFRDKNYRKLISASLVMSGSGIIGRLTNLVERYFSSFFPGGSISNLGLANKLATTPAALVTRPLATVMYAKMAAAESTGDDRSSAAIWQKYLLFAFAVMIPISFLAVYLREDIIGFLFQRKNFTPAMAIQVSLSFAGYAGLLLFGGTGDMINKLYYLKNKVKIPAILNFGGPVIYTVLLYTCIKTWGFLGIPIATSINFTLSGILLLLLGRNVIPGIKILSLFNKIGFIVISFLVGIFVAIYIGQLFNLVPGIIRILLTAIVSISLYVIINLSLNRRFANEILSTLKR